VAGLPPSRASTGLFPVPRLQQLTVYDRVGDLPLLVLTLLVALLRWPWAPARARTQQSPQPHASD
jgi:apolipoprotein N-acyltransferase